MQARNIIKASDDFGEILKVTPEIAGWKHLSFSVCNHGDGKGYHDMRDGLETAIVPLSGSGKFIVAGQEYTLSRTSVFEQMPHILYVTPGESIELEEGGDLTFAIGSAPAEGRYPTRLFKPSEMNSEIRGGGASLRQVNHVLAGKLPAERLILFEVYVPRGMWSGWAPHCHDGRDGSSYLEETYYFRMDPGNGFWMHRNWREEENFDEVICGGDGDCALVSKGYHSSVACPGSNMFFLNYLAGDLLDEKRNAPLCFDEQYTWIHEDWEKSKWELPVVSSD